MAQLLAASREALSAVNPIRLCVERHFVEPMKNCEKDLLKVSVGDPAVFGNLSPHPAAGEAIKKAVDSNRYNGMALSAGIMEVRESVAQYLSKYPSKHKLKADDIFMTCGTHGALETSFRVLCEPGRSILLSSPCYTIYSCLTSSLQITPKHYKLLPDKGWEVDLEDLERQMDSNVAAIVVNNPSNPCGSVYSKQHLLDVLSVAEKYGVPIIADEVYAGMVFKGKEFHPIGSLSENVPVLTCGGISKRFLVPGWRCGWLALHDRMGVLTNVKLGVSNLMTKLVAPASLVQAAIPDMIKNTPDSFFTKTMEVFENNASLCYSKLKGIPGLKPVMPEGALYMMVRIDLPSFPDFKDDLEFIKCLIVEQGVVGLPGSIFQYPDSMRIVLIMPLDKLQLACERISHFCNSHYNPS